MIFIGNQTSCWAARPTEPFDYALSQDFDAFEWFPDKKPGAGWDESDLDSAARTRIRDISRARGMRISVHARWEANPLASGSHELFAKDIKLARDLSAALLNIHLVHEKGIPAFVEAIHQLLQESAEAGLQLAVENTPHHSPEQFNELFSRLHEVTSAPIGHVGLCFDVGHANLSSATLNDYLRFIDRLAPEVPIVHVHAHENWGDADSHLPLFTGPAAQNDAGIRGLVTRLKQRNFSGSIILEQWPQPPSLLKNARDRLLQMWGPTGNGEPAAAVPMAAQPRKLAPAKPGDEFTDELAAGDRRSRSWREKLEFIGGLLAREQPALAKDQLVQVAIYLRFLSSGQIACDEDGRHFRPAHHARLASQIHERLAHLRTPDNEFILRKIYPWLPSSSPTFQRPEPLTRIRDIAHRNDIGPELKQEIKTKLQNKLHRCAGPEDLATSSALLERITAEGAHYPADFVEQFRIFHQELKEFFNAHSLDERLGALRPSADAKQAEMIDTFLLQKDATGWEQQLAALRSLTELRRGFSESIARTSDPRAQEFVLADIALEDFAFVLLSQIINHCDEVNPCLACKAATEALTLSLSNLALSGVTASETRAVESELRAWGDWSPELGRNESLRIRASLLRCRRLSEDFGARIVALFSAKADGLGRAMGVAESAIRVFSEADIRSHLAFQISKLSDTLLRQIRNQLGLTPWDVVVPGRATGRVVTLTSLREWQRTDSGPVLLVLKSADGDEEIPKDVVAIALAQEMPHLAHLSVRARQAGVVFATCEEPAEFERLRGLTGERISFRALPDSVSWGIVEKDGLAAAGPAKQPTQVPDVPLAPEPAWIPLEQATADLAGGKANAAHRLAELAARPGAGFSTPPGLVIPFGVMEAALDALPEVNDEYRDLAKRLNGMGNGEFIAGISRLRKMVLKLQVPNSISAEVRRRFSEGCALAVRSSANCEDLDEFAGAGLYESALNVAPAGVASAIRAVWSSLWTRRAVESRREAGIGHEKAHMAVLVQEMIDPDFSFVLHTVNPITQRPQELYAEVVVGLGETLASAASAGSPYRLSCDKDPPKATTLAFANFSQAARPGPEGQLRSEILDYSKIKLSREPEALEKLGRQLTGIGSFVERACGGPQDIEGAVVKGDIYLVQSRRQQGLPPQA